jgi:hypothetical protein
VKRGCYEKRYTSRVWGKGRGVWPKPPPGPGGTQGLGFRAVLWSSSRLGLPRRLFRPVRDSPLPVDPTRRCRVTASTPPPATPGPEIATSSPRQLGSITGRSPHPQAPRPLPPDDPASQRMERTRPRSPLSFRFGSVGSACCGWDTLTPPATSTRKAGATTLGARSNGTSEGLGNRQECPEIAPDSPAPASGRPIVTQQPSWTVRMRYGANLAS